MEEAKANIIFIFDKSKIYIQCKIDDTMLDICEKASTKICQDINSLQFIYGEKEINFDSKLADYQDLIDKKAYILVYKKESFICPNCKKESQLNKQKLDEIILSNKNIIESFNGIKFQMDTINMMLNIVNQNIKNNEEKINNLFNDNNNNNINNENNINNNSIENITYCSESYIIYEKKGDWKRI